MSAPTAAQPLNRRTLERRGMTPEQELELLIQEQQADDTHVVYPSNHEVSLDALAEFLGYDEDGPISFLRLDEPLMHPDSIPHGTYRGYTRFECRCLKCRGANTAYRRQRRAQGKA